MMMIMMVIPGVMGACHRDEAVRMSLLASRKRLQAEKAL